MMFFEFTAVIACCESPSALAAFLANGQSWIGSSVGVANRKGG
jgi:hypothetical protein